MLWLPILPERQHKFEMIMRALEVGWREPARCIYGMPPDDRNPVVAYGQIWGSEMILRQATETGRLYYHIDNGYWRPGRGRPDGYYRICYCGMTPKFLPACDPKRARNLSIQMHPWRKNGTHILLGLPGPEFGCGIGLDMVSWIARIRDELPTLTGRPIIVRDRKCVAPLEQHLRNCWAVVTHSSNIAVDAVTAGIPVFVAPTSAATPVGNLMLDNLESPVMPDREAWFASLACQQFTPLEMRNGLAYDYLRAIRDAA